MVLINCSVDDGDGYIHLVAVEAHKDRTGGLTLFTEARCGFTFMGASHATWCRASEAGDVLYGEFDRQPDDLADLIMWLRDDGYMCRECVREHWRAVGGIPGLYHDKWTEDLHRDDGHEDEDLKPVHSVVELQCGVTVMRVGVNPTVAVDGECPTCDSTLAPMRDGDGVVSVLCSKCRWERAVDLPPA